MSCASSHFTPYHPLISSSRLTLLVPPFSLSLLLLHIYLYLLFLLVSDSLLSVSSRLLLLRNVWLEDPSPTISPAEAGPFLWAFICRAEVLIMGSPWRFALPGIVFPLCSGMGCWGDFWFDSPYLRFCATSSCSWEGRIFFNYGGVTTYHGPKATKNTQSSIIHSYIYIYIHVGRSQWTM